uniref:Gustatory receptor n=1 Tax=Anopheles culicifacies TaxID=139723 RepID=A0A182MR74_9DIPT
MRTRAARHLFVPRVQRHVIGVYRLRRLLAGVLYGIIFAAPFVLYYVDSGQIYVYSIPLSIKLMYYVQTAIQTVSMGYVLLVYQFRTSFHRFYFERLVCALEEFSRPDMDARLYALQANIRRTLPVIVLYIVLIVTAYILREQSWTVLPKIVIFLATQLMATSLTLLYVVIFGTVSILLHQMNDTLEGILRRKPILDKSSANASLVPYTPISLTRDDERTVEKIRLLQLKLLQIVLRINGGEYGQLLIMNLLATFIFLNTELLQLYQGVKAGAFSFSIIASKLLNSSHKIAMLFMFAYPNRLIQTQDPSKSFQIVRILRRLLSAVLFIVVIAVPLLLYYLYGGTLHVFKIPLSIKLMFYLQALLQTGSLGYILLVYQFRASFHRFYFDRLVSVLVEFGRPDIGKCLYALQTNILRLLFAILLLVVLIISALVFRDRSWTNLLKVVIFLATQLMATSLTLHYMTLFGVVTVLLRQMNDTLELMLERPRTIPFASVRLTRDDEQTIEKIRLLQLQLLRIVLRTNGGEFGRLLIVMLLTIFLFLNTEMLQLYQGIKAAAFTFDVIGTKLTNSALKFAMLVMYAFSNRQIQQQNLRGLKLLFQLHNAGNSARCHDITNRFITQTTFFLQKAHEAYGMLSIDMTLILSEIGTIPCVITHAIPFIVSYLILMQYYSVLIHLSSILRKLNERLVPLMNMKPLGSPLLLQKHHVYNILGQSINFGHLEQIEQLRLMHVRGLEIAGRLSGNFGMVIVLIVVAAFASVNIELLELYQSIKLGNLGKLYIVMKFLFAATKLSFYILIAYPNRLIQNEIEHYITQISILQDIHQACGMINLDMRLISNKNFPDVIRIMYHVESWLRVLLVLIGLAGSRLSGRYFRETIDTLVHVMQLYDHAEKLERVLGGTSIITNRLFLLYCCHTLIVTTTTWIGTEHPFSTLLIVSYIAPYITITLYTLLYRALLSSVGGIVRCLGDTLGEVVLLERNHPERSPYSKHTTISYIRLHNVKQMQNHTVQDDVATIEKLSTLHMALMRLVREANKQFGVLMLTIVLSSFIQINILLIELYHNIGHPVLPEYSQWVYFLHALVHFTFFMVIAKSNHTIQQQFVLFIYYPYLLYQPKVPIFIVILYYIVNILQTMTIANMMICCEGRRGEDYE